MTDAAPLHVGFVGPYPPIRGGIAQHSHQLVAALRERGHDVDVHSWRAQYPRVLYRGSQAAAPGATEAPGTSGGAADEVTWSLRWWAPWSWVLVGRRLRNVDLIVAPWVHPFHALALWVVLAVAGRPAVTVVHNLVPHERLPGDRWVARWVLRRAHGALVHSGSVEDDVAEVLPEVPRRRIPHPPNLPLAAEPLPGPPPRVLFLGYVRPYKGVDVLLAALQQPGMEDVHATIAGEMWSPTSDELAAELHDRGLEGRVSLEPGYVADDRVRDLLSEHHLLVAPYRSATQSGLVPLAHAAGRAVVATSVGGLRDQVDDGVDGVLVPNEDPVALADGIRGALDRCEELAAGAAAAATRWADVAVVVEELARPDPTPDPTNDRVGQR